MYEYFSQATGWLHAALVAAQGAGPMAAKDPDWAFWPLGPTRAFWPMAAKLFLVLFILGGIAFGLRKLFGPGGMMREPWIDEANEQMRAQERAGIEAREARAVMETDEARTVPAPGETDGNDQG